MPANFLPLAWPLVFAMLLLAGLIVSLAAIATLVAAITRARHLGKEMGSHANEGKDDVDRADDPAGKFSHRQAPRSAQEPVVMETFTTDGNHYIPVP